MAVTIIGPSVAEFPSWEVNPQIDVKRKWSDDWIMVPELQLRQANVVSGGGQHSGCQLVYEYGRLKHPWQTALSDYASWDLRGWWARVRFFGTRGWQVAWIGKISTEDRLLEGADVTRSGRQTWQGWGPERILQKIHVSKSYWWTPGVSDLLWVPSMNARDERGSLVGNRCDEAHDDQYYYGGTETWNHRQYCEYLLRHFVDEGGEDGPAWTLGGAAEILEEFETVIEMSTTQTVADVLGRLIPREYGVDYVIYPTIDEDGVLRGFEVFVYALTAIEHSFGDATLPVNPRTVRISASRAIENIRTRIVRTDDHRYEKIRVLGARPVVCLSLWGTHATPPAGTVTPSRLVSKWTTAAEDEYKAGAGAGAGILTEAHDRARQSEQLKSVYQSFGATDEAGLATRWDASAAGAAVTFDAEGNYDPSPAPADEVEWQTFVRDTLSWLPLREGFDYTPAVPVDNNPAGFQPELMPPCVWVTDRAEDAGYPDQYIYQRADAVGIGVGAPLGDWGVQLSAPANHVMALSDWTGAQPTQTQPLWSWQYSVATIALHTDGRLALEIEIPEDDDGDGATPSGGVLDIEVDDAEFWLLAPDTVVSTDSAGMLQQSPGTAQVLRDDRGRLVMVLAGGLARYFAARARAEVHVKGLKSWTQLVGQVLTVVEEAGDVEPIQAPITSVEWNVSGGGDEADSDATTIIRTGFAE